jgi:hypothetical protein
MTRIEELTKQAIDLVNNEYKNLGPDRWIEVYNIKFARLVIQDCNNVLKDSVANYDERALFHPRQIAEHATILVNKHFGVEE